MAYLIAWTDNWGDHFQYFESSDVSRHFYEIMKPDVKKIYYCNVINEPLL
jgi:hypothetical protein